MNLKLANSSKISGCVVTAQPIVKIAPGVEGVSIWSAALFGEPGHARLREFLGRVFSVEEVAAVEIRRAKSFARVRYNASANVPDIWRNLSQALKHADAPHPGNAVGFDRLGVDGLYLDGPFTQPIQIIRIGGSLST